MTDREIIKKLMEKTGQVILSEANGYIEYNNPCYYGKNITFEFDEDGSLINVIS